MRGYRLSPHSMRFEEDRSAYWRDARSAVHDFISPAAFNAWVITACTSIRLVRTLFASSASATGSPAMLDVSAVARSWRGGAGTIEADSLRLIVTARGCPVRPQNFAM